MMADGHEVAHLSSALEGHDRDIVIDRFRKGQAKVLITTNVIARGIDVSSVTMVVNYDIPTKRNGDADAETYLHRIGRTGRFGRVGVAVTFISDRDQWMRLAQIQRHFGVEIENLNRNDWDAVEESVKSAIKHAKIGQKKQVRAANESDMQTDGASA
jgi:ATP-dependent RNA helicase DDX19/DBP5